MLENTEYIGDIDRYSVDFVGKGGVRHIRSYPRYLVFAEIVLVPSFVVLAPSFVVGQLECLGFSSKAVRVPGFVGRYFKYRPL